MNPIACLTRQDGALVVIDPITTEDVAAEYGDPSDMRLECVGDEP
jgi:hypothetical protein